jgi:hypothetical protein
MRSTLTFNNVYDSDLELTGSAGHDLARAHRLSKLVPPSFIVTSSVYNKFMDIGVEKTIKKLLKSGILDDKKVRLLFSATHLPNDLLLELKEAYESLNVGGSSLLSTGEPTVNLFLSPDYYSEYDFSQNIILNITGFSNFIDALKTLWFRLHSKENREYRIKNGVEFFSCGVVVQKAVKVDACVEAHTDGQKFFFEAYKGSVDITGRITKDKLVGSFQSPEDYKLKVASQEFKLVHDEKSGNLVKLYLKDKSNDIKVSSQVFSEIFRVTKKIKYGFSSDIKALFYVDKDRIYILYVQSLPNLHIDVEKQEEKQPDLDLPNLTQSSGEIVYNMDGVHDEQNVVDTYELEDDDVNLIHEVKVEDEVHKANFDYNEKEDDVEDEDIKSLDDVEDVDDEKEDDVEDHSESDVYSNLKETDYDDEKEETFEDEDVESLEKIHDLKDETKPYISNEAPKKEAYDLENVELDDSEEDSYDLDEMEAEEDSRHEKEEYYVYHKEEKLPLNNGLPNLDDDFIMEEEGVPSPEDVFNKDKFTKEETPEEEDDDFLFHNDDLKEEVEDSTVKEDIKPSTETGLGLNSLYNSFKEVVEEFYKDSYGFSPIDKRRALFELNIKYGLKDFEDLVDFDELMHRRSEGHSIDEDLLSRCIESVKRFIKENAKS